MLQNENETEQEKLAEETGPPPKQRRKTSQFKTTVTSRFKTVVEQEINCGSELRNKNTSKQLEEPKKETQANEKNLNKFEQTSKEHARDKKMLAWEDEAGYFLSFESMTDYHWRSIKTFSKQGCVQDIVNFYINGDLFSRKNDFLDIFYTQTCLFKINFSCGFILRIRSDNSLCYCHASNGCDRIFYHPKLSVNFLILL